jgi:hypothetical protein
MLASRSQPEAHKYFVILFGSISYIMTNFGTLWFYLGHITQYPHKGLYVVTVVLVRLTQDVNYQYL